VNGRNTIMHRMGDGWSLKIVAAMSPRSLRRHTARTVYANEIDAMECSEGDPLKLGERRTLTNRNRKLVAGSSLVCKLLPQSCLARNLARLASR
jgi:phage terminase large subunit GpA-like protein